MLEFFRLSAGKPAAASQGLSLENFNSVELKFSGHQNRDTPYSARKPRFCSSPRRKSCAFATDRKSDLSVAFSVSQGLALRNFFVVTQKFLGARLSTNAVAFVDRQSGSSPCRKALLCYWKLLKASLLRAGRLELEPWLVKPRLADLANLRIPYRQVSSTQHFQKVTKVTQD